MKRQVSLGLLLLVFGTVQSFAGTLTVSVNAVVGASTVHSSVSAQYSPGDFEYPSDSTLIGNYKLKTNNTVVQGDAWGVHSESFFKNYDYPAAAGACYVASSDATYSTCNFCIAESLLLPGFPVYASPVSSLLACTPSSTGGGGGGTTDCTPTETNPTPCTGGGGFTGSDYRTDTCYYQVWDCMSPIVFNLQNGGYQLSGTSSAVMFDIDADGAPDRMGWTAAGEQMGFLALDRNGNGRIDDGSELFGDHTPKRDGSIAHNGFEALRDFDSNGDGVIDASDAVWSRLLVWIDANHDGISTPDELQPISSTGITSIDLAYHWTGRRDQNGNCFRYEGKVHAGQAAKPFYDIYFLVAR